jgi:hypothetical protein
MVVAGKLCAVLRKRSRNTDGTPTVLTASGLSMEALIVSGSAFQEQPTAALCVYRNTMDAEEMRKVPGPWTWGYSRGLYHIIAEINNSLHSSARRRHVTYVKLVTRFVGSRYCRRGCFRGGQDLVSSVLPR